MEFLNKDKFKKEMKQLQIIYNYKTTTEQMALYYKYLKNKMSDDIFALVCKEIIMKETFFPAVSVFLKYKPIPNWKKAF